MDQVTEQYLREHLNLDLKRVPLQEHIGNIVGNLIKAQPQKVLSNHTLFYVANQMKPGKFTYQGPLHFGNAGLLFSTSNPHIKKNTSFEKIKLKEAITTACKQMYDMSSEQKVKVIPRVHGSYTYDAIRNPTLYGTTDAITTWLEELLVEGEFGTVPQPAHTIIINEKRFNEKILRISKI